MLSIHKNQLNTTLNTTFERIVLDKNGVLVCVRFIVVEVNGKFQAQIVSVKALKQDSENRGENNVTDANVFCLPSFSQKINHAEKFVKSYYYTISPYSPLTFYMSQPTRAPSF